MRFVVYDEETLEPLTVVSLKPNWVNFLKTNRCIKVPIRFEVNPVDVNAPMQDMQFEPTSVTLHAYSLRSPSGAETLVLLAGDGENALRLYGADILPGQRRLLEDAYNKGLQEGISAVLSLRTGE